MKVFRNVLLAFMAVASLLTTSCMDREEVHPIKYIFMCTVPAEVKLEYWVDDELVTKINPSSQFDGSPKQLNIIYGFRMDTINPNYYPPMYFEVSSNANHTEYIGMKATVWVSSSPGFTFSYWDKANILVIYDDKLILRRYVDMKPGKTFFMETAHMRTKDLVRLYDKNPDYFPPVDSVWYHDGGTE